ANSAASFDLVSTGGHTLMIGSGGIHTFSSNTQVIDLKLVMTAAQTFNADSGNLTLNGTVDNGGFLLTVDGAHSTTMNGVISGLGGLTKNGNGTLTLNAVNTFMGPVTVNAGTVTAGINGALPNDVDYTVNGGTLNLNNFNVTMK